MASPEMKILITAKDKASREIKKVNKAFLAGGLSAKSAAKQIGVINKTLKDTKTASGEATTGMSKFTKGIAKGNLAAMAAKKTTDLLIDAIKKVGEETYKATLVAAQIEELGAVYRFVGKNAGYTTAQLTKYNQVLRISGIRQDVANQSLLRAIQANIDLNQAVKFARIGQDAATVGLMESSEAYQRIIDSVAKLYPRLLKEIGIIINLNTEYAKYAQAHKINVNQMTEAQKKQSMMNAILEKGARLTGAYETAMEKVSKQIRSLPRYYMDAQQAIGEFLVPALEMAVTSITKFLKALKKLFQSTRSEIEESIALRLELNKSSIAILKVADAYDKLSIKKNKSIAEMQKEKEAMKTLAYYEGGILIDAWDNLGNVISINTGKLREHASAEEGVWSEKTLGNLQKAKAYLQTLDDDLLAIQTTIKSLEQDESSFKWYLGVLNLLRPSTKKLLDEAKKTQVALQEEKKEFIASIDPMTNFDLLVKLIGYDAAKAALEIDRLTRVEKFMTEQFEKDVDIFDKMFGASRALKATDIASKILGIQQALAEKLKILNELKFDEDEDREKRRLELIETLEQNAATKIASLQKIAFDKAWNAREDAARSTESASKRHLFAMDELQSIGFEASIAGLDEWAQKEARLYEKHRVGIEKLTRQKISTEQLLKKAMADQDIVTVMALNTELVDIDKALTALKVLELAARKAFIKAFNDWELAEAQKLADAEKQIVIEGITGYAYAATQIENRFTDQTVREREQLQERLDNEEAFSRKRRDFSQQHSDEREELANREFATEEARREAERELDNQHFEERLEFDRAIAEERARIQEEASRKTIGEKIKESVNFVVETKKQYDAIAKFNKLLKKQGGLQKALTATTGSLGKAFNKTTTAVWDAIKASAAWIAAQVKMIAKTIAAAAVTAAKAVAGIPIVGPGLAIAAAAMVAAGLTKLVGAFDDPRNDAVAFRWGSDAGKFFMKGFTKETGAPQFGEKVVGSMRGSIMNMEEPTPANVIQHITVHAEGKDARELAAEFEELSRNGETTLMIDEEETYR